MAIESKKSIINDAAASFYLKSPSGATSNQLVSLSSHWSNSQSKRAAEMFNVGGGCVYNSYPEHNNGFGSYVFTPTEDFIGEVHVWGAGGGAYYNSGGRYAGGGGFTQATIRFKANTPYTIVVGQAGNHNDSTTHGGGGRGHNSGGAGGGLSGIFMNIDAPGSAVWNGTPTVTQESALVIGGGGGGGGHHTQGTNYGNGGGGGGWNGKRGHNSAGGTQTAGGGAGYSNAQAGFALHGGHSGNNTSWLGGGGGGWFGGGGGGHSAAHHNGGSGGSGHIAYSSGIGSQPNNNKAVYVLNGFTDKAPGHMEYSSGHPAAYNHPLCATEGRWAGQGGHGENSSGSGCTWGSRHGKVVITMLPEIIGKIMDKFPTHTAAHDNTGWTQSF